MGVTIQLKHNYNEGRTPSASTMQEGELYINNANSDGKSFLCTKKHGNNNNIATWHEDSLITRATSADSVYFIGTKTVPTDISTGVTKDKLSMAMSTIYANEGKLNIPIGLTIGEQTLTEKKISVIPTEGKKTRSNYFTYSIVLSCQKSMSFSLYINIRKEGGAIENGKTTSSTWEASNTTGSFLNSLVTWLNGRTSIVQAYDDDGNSVTKVVKVYRGYGTWEIQICTSARLDILSVEEASYTKDFSISISETTKEGNKFYDINGRQVTTTNGQTYIDENEDIIYANKSGSLIPINCAYVYGYIVEHNRYRITLHKLSSGTVSCTVSINASTTYSKTYTGVEYSTIIDRIVSDINSNAGLSQRNVRAYAISEDALDINVPLNTYSVTITGQNNIESNVTYKSVGLYSDADYSTMIECNERVLYADKQSNKIYTWNKTKGFTLLSAINGTYTKSEIDKTKQDTLVGETGNANQNIKSINGNSILGSGNIELQQKLIAGSGITISGNTISITPHASAATFGAVANFDSKEIQPITEKHKVSITKSLDNFAGVKTDTQLEEFGLTEEIMYKIFDGDITTLKMPDKSGNGSIVLPIMIAEQNDSRCFILIGYANYTYTLEKNTQLSNNGTWIITSAAS